jgi:DNA-directed RNA polymerase specialized sigma24 family protein
MSTPKDDAAEKGLLARCLNGDNAAWMEFFQLHDDVIIAAIRRALQGRAHNVGTVEEIVQNTHVALFKRRQLLNRLLSAIEFIDASLTAIAKLETKHFFFEKKHRRKVFFVGLKMLMNQVQGEEPGKLLWQDFLGRLTCGQRAYVLAEVKGLAGEAKNYTAREVWELRCGIRKAWREMLDEN